MRVSDILFFKCLQKLKPFPLWWTHIEKKHSGRMGQILLDIECSTLPCENIPPSVLLGDENLNNTHVSRDAQASCRLVSHFISNKHTHPFELVTLISFQRKPSKYIVMISPNNNTVLNTMTFTGTSSSRITLGICMFIFSWVIMESKSF